MLLPETFHSIPSVDSIGDIKKVEVKLYSYAGADLNNGYTKINIFSLKPINLEAQVKTTTTALAPQVDAGKLAQLDNAFGQKSSSQSSSQNLYIAPSAQKQKELDAIEKQKQELENKRIELKAQELLQAQEAQKLKEQKEILEAQKKNSQGVQITPTTIQNGPKIIEVETNKKQETPQIDDISVAPSVGELPKELIETPKDVEIEPIETDTEETSEDKEENKEEAQTQLPTTIDSNASIMDKIKPYIELAKNNLVVSVALIIAALGTFFLFVSSLARRRGSRRLYKEPQAQPIQPQYQQSFAQTQAQYAKENHHTIESFEDNTEEAVETYEQNQQEAYQEPVQNEPSPYDDIAVDEDEYQEDEEFLEYTDMLNQEPEEELVEPTILTSAEIAPNRGFVVIDKDGQKALLGYIHDEIFMIHQFVEELVNYDIKFKMSEKQDDKAFFIVKVDTVKVLVKVSTTKMSLELVM